ncbi:hypothetical protein BOO88_18700 [Stutzerimonas stutzeri]|nr:hypothetical protein BOO89_00195 [Stutzerimonas stutzeri]AZO90845.1 hypothetical protein BOO88_18700 [Stutzerimonas stutzeri]
MRYVGKNAGGRFAAQREQAPSPQESDLTASDRSVEHAGMQHNLRGMIAPYRAPIPGDSDVFVE